MLHIFWRSLGMELQQFRSVYINKMSKYRIKQTAPFLWVITLLLVIFLGVAILITLVAYQIFPPGAQLLFILMLIPIIILAFMIPQYFATGEVEIEVSDSAITKNWIKQIRFQKRADSEIKWVDIAAYRYTIGRKFSRFKLTAKNKASFLFYHSGEENKDDFRQFLTDFELQLKNNNAAGITNNIKNPLW